jgi:ketosteroid isomerase-like protein
MSLSRNEIEKALKQWNLAWDNHDLEGVMALFHEEVVFDNWTGGKVRGKETLRKAWKPGIFGLWRKKPSSMKKSKRFFTAGCLNGLRLKAGTKESLKNEEASM